MFCIFDKLPSDERSSLKHMLMQAMLMIRPCMTAAAVQCQVPAKRGSTAAAVTPAKKAKLSAAAPAATAAKHSSASKPGEGESHPALLCPTCWAHCVTWA